MFQIVVIEAPYYTLENPFVEIIYSRMLSHRLKCYRKKYQEGVLPFGNEDYLSTHAVLCIKENDLLVPVTMFKFLPVKICHEFGIELPVIKWLKDKRNPPSVIESFNNYLEKNQHRNLGYMGSYTEDTSRKSQRRIIRQFTLMMYWKLFEYMQIDEIFGVALESAVKTFSSMEMDKIIRDKVVVPDITDAFGYVIYTRKLLEEYQNLASGVLSYWNTRIHISQDQDIETTEEVIERIAA